MEYDPMISKLVAWGEDREHTLMRMLRALEEYHLLGIRTNIPYLRKIIMHPEFISGDYDTHFIPKHQETLLAPEAGEADKLETIALATAAILHFKNSEKQLPACRPGAQSKTSAWKLSGRMHNNGSMV